MSPQLVVNERCLGFGEISVIDSLGVSVRFSRDRECLVDKPQTAMFTQHIAGDIEIARALANRRLSEFLFYLGKINCVVSRA